MEPTEDTSAQFFAVDTRLESFQVSKPAAKRKSTTKGKTTKALAWPHKQLDPVDLARAGFFFDPTPEQPDNVVCFLCERRLGGWEEGDNPFEEHLRLSPNCGWAIVSAIEIGLGDYCQDDPAHPQMVEARRATFADRWPHEGKKGWKCKTKQLVEAGWKYTPAPGYEDMATCTYCSLALDGWEPKDNPMNEHYKRSPDCKFFSLTEQHQQAGPKKAARGKAARLSKASRLSSQSDATATTDMTESIIEAPAEYEDSVMTTASVATQGGTKKPRAKKAATTKAKKTKAKKEEPVDVTEDLPAEESLNEPILPPAKPARGKKRASEQVDESTLISVEAPAPKKRATRKKASKAANESSVLPEHDIEMEDEEPVPAPKKRGRPSKAKAQRNVSTASEVSEIIEQGESDHMMDDADIERQLQSDLDRPLTDDEDLDADSDSERRRVSVGKTTTTKSSGKRSSTASRQGSGDHHAMFDPSPVEIDEQVIEEEFKTMQADTQLVDGEFEEPETLPKPSKVRKAGTGTRKVSKQTKKVPTSPPAPSEPESRPGAENRYDDDVDELAEGHEDSIISNTAAATKPAPVASSAAVPAAALKKRGPAPKKSTTAKSLARTSAQDSESPDLDDFPEPPKPKKAAAPKKVAPVAKEKSLPPSPPPPARDELGETPATPRSKMPATARAKHATMSPSQSPQSSDAENQPPSSRPSGTTERKRVVLVPVVTTPTRTSPSKMSPSKRHLMSGLESERPWSAVDVEAIFEDLEKENANGTSNLLQGGPELTSPEQRMSVEEWIYFNARQAEQKLKYECEAMVSAFEREGARAMQTLEGLVIE
ncbi:baculoviral IAP repeat-containing protein 2/3 [Microdochium nivale]|nr:baculoviral IAP repeat-containing protein 2/3 [Microdochium nivale]